MIAKPEELTPYEKILEEKVATLKAESDALKRERDVAKAEAAILRIDLNEMTRSLEASKRRGSDARAERDAALAELAEAKKAHWETSGKLGLVESGLVETQAQLSAADSPELRTAIRRVLKHHNLCPVGDGVVEADLAQAVIDAALVNENDGPENTQDHSTG